MNLKLLENITISELKPELMRKTTSDVACYLKNFEECLENYNSSFPFSLLHYAFIFRRFDIICMIKNALSDSDWEEALKNIKGPDGYEWITLVLCQDLDQVKMSSSPQ